MWLHLSLSWANSVVRLMFVRKKKKTLLGPQKYQSSQKTPPKIYIYFCLLIIWNHKIHNQGPPLKSLGRMHSTSFVILIELLGSLMILRLAGTTFKAPGLIRGPTWMTAEFDDYTLTSQNEFDNGTCSHWSISLKLFFFCVCSLVFKSGWPHNWTVGPFLGANDHLSHSTAPLLVAKGKKTTTTKLPKSRLTIKWQQK